MSCKCEDNPSELSYIALMLSLFKIYRAVGLFSLDHLPSVVQCSLSISELDISSSSIVKDRDDN